MHQCGNLFDGEMETRVSSLQRNIDFLQKQHKEILEKLHAEIDGLKRENKELQYKLIMEPVNSSSKGSSHRVQRRCAENKFQRDRRNYLEQTLNDSCSSQNTEIRVGLSESNLSKATHCLVCDECTSLIRETSSNSSCTNTADKGEGPLGAIAGFITSLQPLMIQCSPSQAPRPPSLQECEVIIRQLYNANSLQSQEILRVKAVLKDIVFNKKITAENYILTKAYLSDGKRVGHSETFPQLSLQTLPRGLPVSQTSRAEKVILPALKQTLNNNIADRHRRTQAVQRRRLQRTMR